MIFIGHHGGECLLKQIESLLLNAIAGAKKRKAYQGTMTHSQGLISGIILSAFIALLSPLTQWITSTIITPEYFPNVIEYALESGYVETRAEAEAQFNLNSYMVQGAIGALIMGILTTAIAMIFIRSKS